MLTVACFLWFDPRGKRNPVYAYAREHVARLKAMLARHLHLAHELVCVTDAPDQVAGVCRVVPLDRRTFVPGTRYAKLMLFRRDIGDILGRRILYLDLDCVIVDDIATLVGRTEPLVLWRNPNAKIPRRARYNSSIMLLTAGCRPDLYEEFNPRRHPAEIRAYTSGTDQAWISHVCGPDHPHWDSSHGIHSAPRGRDVPAHARLLPAGARIVFFPGQHEPGMKSCQERFPWIAQHLPQ